MYHDVNLYILHLYLRLGLQVGCNMYPSGLRFYTSRLNDQEHTTVFQGAVPVHGVTCLYKSTIRLNPSSIRIVW